MYTSGFLAALAEVLAGKLAGVPVTSNVSGTTEQKKKQVKQHPSLAAHLVFQTLGLNKRAIQMFVYGFAISAPLGHFLTGLLQKAFAGKTTTRDKIAQVSARVLPPTFF